MGLAIKNEEGIERRDGGQVNTDDLWSELTLPQKFAASSLTKFGYELSCIRDANQTHIAILSCNDNVAVISKTGDINTDPDIKIRL